MPDPPYEQDTLRFVAAEVRFPVIDEFAAQVPQELRERLAAAGFPVQESVQQMTFAIGTGPGLPTPQQEVRQRFFARDRYTSATVGREVVLLETTAYTTWSEFRDLFTEILSALADSRRPEGYLRVGLRYVDEIRVPAEIETFADWQGWVADALVAPFTMNDAAELKSAVTMMQYGARPGYQTVFRATPFPEGRTVSDDGPLRLPFPTPEGPYFLLDTDASWADPQGAFPEFEVPAITEALETLHAPCKRLFEESITDRLREEVLNRPREEVWQ